MVCTLQEYALQNKLKSGLPPLYYSIVDISWAACLPRYPMLLFLSSSATAMIVTHCGMRHIEKYWLFQRSRITNCIYREKWNWFTRAQQSSTYKYRDCWLLTSWWHVGSDFEAVLCDIGVLAERCKRATILKLLIKLCIVMQRSMHNRLPLCSAVYLPSCDSCVRYQIYKNTQTFIKYILPYANIIETVYTIIYLNNL